MKFVASYSKYVKIHVEAKTYEEAQKIADFVLEQRPESAEDAPWFLHVVRKSDCQKMEDAVYKDG